MNSAITNLRKKLVQVAVDAPLEGLFDYFWEFEQEPELGVPLLARLWRGRITVGRQQRAIEGDGEHTRVVGKDPTGGVEDAATAREQCDGAAGRELDALAQGGRIDDLKEPHAGGDSP